SMKTELNLIAQPGEYAGRDTEINGIGYAGMTFTAKAVSRNDFDEWVRNVKGTAAALDPGTYAALAAPSTDNPPAFYSPVAQDLFDSIMMKYLKPAAATPPQTKPKMDME
ncbi:MAG TPA: COX aromatic rich motif-containing protein, partial [Patescibacteria group bacterium]|nr:COX aromatic rich motif-containing protein [Patescibacteria group bacterium]